MTKAILIVDMPAVCYGCDYCKFDGGYRHGYYGRTCLLTGEDVQNNFDITTARHETCPLKPMPEKKDLPVYYAYKEFDKEIGYNNCIDEILGEENE